MALRPDRRFGGAGEADDNKLLRCWDGEKRFHLGLKRIPSCHAQEQLSGWYIETIPL